MTLDIIVALMSEILSVAEEDLGGGTPLTPEQGVEAIDVAKLMIEIERRFDVTIYDEVVHTFKTLGDVAEYVDTLDIFDAPD